MKILKILTILLIGLLVGVCVGGYSTRYDASQLHGMYYQAGYLAGTVDRDIVWRKAVATISTEELDADMAIPQEVEGMAVNQQALEKAGTAGR